MIASIDKDVTGASSVLVSTLYMSVLQNINGSDRIQTGAFTYAEKDGTKFIAVPMQGNMSLVCITGNRTDMFDKLDSLGKEKKTVCVSFPEFELRSVYDSSDLLNYLITRGLDESFNRQLANFYNMCQDSDWFLQEIIQVAKVSFNQEAAVKNFPDAPDNSGDKDDIKDFDAEGSFSFIVFYGFGTSDQQALLYGQRS